MQNLKVALGFTRLSDGDLSGFTSNIIKCFTGNSTFAKPPVALTDLSKLQAAFDTAVAAALDGGTALTAAKNAARDALLSALRRRHGSPARVWFFGSQHEPEAANETGQSVDPVS